MATLRAFVADLMERRGAAVEPVEPDGLMVIAPPDVRSAFGWPELALLGFGSELPASAQRVGMEGDWLERFGGQLGGHGRHAARQIVSDQPPPGDPERIIGQALDLPNAVWRFQGLQQAWARCLILSFRTTAVSDEKRENLLWMGFNTSTGATLEPVLERLRASLDREAAWQAPDPAVVQAAGGGWTGPALEGRVRPVLDSAVRAELAPFLQAMRRRLVRDHGRLHGYHDDLRRESLKRLNGLAGLHGDKADADRLRETQRVAAIEREYRAKLDDLRHNYALRVTVDWIQTLELFVPVQRLAIQIRRRKGERLIHLDWHPLVRQAEPPLCDWGLGESITRLVCDERLHLTEPAGQAPCSGCGKAFCRACHPSACPKCGTKVAAAGGVVAA